MAKDKKAEKGKTSLEEEAEKKALDDYDKRLKEVLDLKAMTDTSAWEKFWSALQERLKLHGKLILEVEKTREIVQHQEGVKLIKKIMEMCRGPVDNLNSYITEMPLYSKHMKTRADFNDTLGKVILSKSE